MLRYLMRLNQLPSSVVLRSTLYVSLITSDKCPVKRISNLFLVQTDTAHRQVALMEKRNTDVSLKQNCIVIKNTSLCITWSKEENKMPSNRF